MWCFLPNSFISIVQKPGDADTLTVRSRVNGDIERVFPNAEVIEGAGTDYQFRARVPRAKVAKAMHDAVMNLTWSNFKGAVTDRKRHDAYMRVWAAMMDYQRQMAAKPR